MAENYRIEIDVTQKSSPGKSRSGAQADLSEQVARGRRLLEQEKDPNKRGGLQNKLYDNNKALMELAKNIPLLSREIKTLRLDMQRQARGIGPFGRGGASAPGAVGGGGGGGRGPGIGGVGAAIPFLGAAVAAGGYIISQVMRIGRAYLEKAVAQLPTAGIGGFMRGGAFDYLSSEQLGQFIRERQLARGGVIQPMTKERESNIRNLGKNRETQSAIQYMKVFGQQGGQMGQMMGVLDMFSGGKGGQSLSRLIEKFGGRGGGLRAELPDMLKQIQSVLEEAMREGLNSSTLAEDTARELTLLAKTLPNQDIRAALGMQQSLMGMQTGLARGQNITSIMGHTMFRSGRQIVRRALGNMNDPITQMLMRENMILPETVQKFQKTGQLDPALESVLVQRLMQERGGDVRKRMVEELENTFMKGPGSADVKRARMFNILQPETGGLPPTQFYSMFGLTKKGGTPDQTDVRRALTQQEQQMRPSTTAQGRKITMEILQLGEIAQRASVSVMTMENSIINMITKIEQQGGITKTIDGLTGLIGALGDVGAVAAGKLAPLVKVIGDAISEWGTETKKHGLLLGTAKAAVKTIVGDPLVNALYQLVLQSGDPKKMAEFKQKYKDFRP